MRGKGQPARLISTVGGITPAYAGKRSVRRLHKGIRWDHPRLCGEKLIPIEFGGIETGSPPPMRGKVEEFIMKKIDVRITPAYAGKRLCTDAE